MAKLKIKRAVSFVMATVLSLTAFMGVGANTAFAAAGEKTNVYMVDFPRDGDANCDGVWGYNNLTLKNGWHTGSATHTNLKAIGSFSGNVGYCIEPGVHLSMGQSMTQYDENYFNNIQANGVISGDEIRQYIGRILQYGYRGTISTSWRSQNEAAANSIAHAYATQLLIWETIVGERDANFNHKAASGCSNVKDVVNAIDIQHIGSTAIPAIKAKPIIDIVVGVTDFDKVMLHNEQLRQVGIFYRGSDVERQFLYVMGDMENDTRTHHIHIVKWNGTEWKNYIHFRDYLNDNENMALQYQKVKEELESKYADDRVAYTNGKQDMIDLILDNQ